MTIPVERLDQIASRFAEMEARLASGTLEGEAFVAASRDYAELEPVARAAEAVRRMRAELAELEGLDDADPDMKALAEEEVMRLRNDLPDAERALAIAILPRDAADARPAMLEIRAGTGGDEALGFDGLAFSEALASSARGGGDEQEVRARLGEWARGIAVSTPLEAWIDAYRAQRLLQSAMAS